MQKNFFLLLLCTLLGFSAASQVYLEPYAGFQVDLNSNKAPFKQINTGLQCSFTRSSSYEFVMQGQLSAGLNYKSADSAFTNNINLPVYAPAAKKVTPYAISFALLNRITVAGKKKANTFYIVPGIGGTYQSIRVYYSHDKDNYTILNPDKTLSHAGIYLCLGATWIHALKNGRFFTSVNFCTPSLGAKAKYLSSFKFLAPAALNAGYSFNIK